MEQKFQGMELPLLGAKVLRSESSCYHSLVENMLRAREVLVYVLFDRGRWVTISTVVAAVTLRSLRSFFIAFDFNSLKIQLRLIGVTFWAAMTQKLFPTQTEV